MAWEEESIETGADFEEVGGKKNKLKLIVILVVVIALAGAGYFFKDKFLGGDDAEPTKEATSEGKASDSGKTPPAVESDDDEDDEDDSGSDTPGVRVNLEKFTINLSGGGTPHFLVTTIVLEVSTPEMKEKMVDPESLEMIKTRDTINRLLMAQDYNDIKGASTDATDDIALAIKTRLNKKLKYTGGKVLNVYFSEFLID